MARVNFTTYKKYQSYVGGLLQLILTNLTLTVFIVLKIAGDYLVGDWAISED